ncbi:hypothetical protein [Angustibacter aerolatus]
MTAPGAAFAATTAAPTALTPDTTATRLKNLELKWAAVPGATSYDLQVVDSDDTVVSQSVVGATRWTVPTSIPRGEYTWRVRASVPTRGSWSSFAAFEKGWDAVPTGTFTRHDGVLPVMSWNPVKDASFYEVEISDSPFGDYGDVESGRKKHWICYTTNTVFTPYGVSAGAEQDPAPGGEGDCAYAADSTGDATATSLGTKWILGQDYYWRVRARDGAVDTRETAFVNPSVGCTGVWTDSDADDEGGIITVPIGMKPPVYDATPECSNWSVDTLVTPTYTVPNPTDTVPAVPSGLTVGPTATGASSAMDVVTTASPVLSWSAVPYAFKYRVYLSRTSDFKDSDVVWETQGTSLASVSDLALNSTGKYWTVQACFVKCSAPAPVHRIRKAAATDTSVVSALAKADGSAVNVIWNLQTQGTRFVAGQPAPRVGARSYEVQLTDVATGDPASTSVTDRVSAYGESTSHLTVDTTGLPEGVYTAHVRGVSETSRPLPWSADSREFVIDRGAPSLRPATSGNFAGRAYLPIVTSEPVTGATSSTLGVQTAAGAKVPGTITKVNDLQYRFTPSASWVPGQYYKLWATSAVRDRADKPVTVPSTTVRAKTTADDNQTASPLKFTSGDRSWTTSTASDAWGGTYRRTADDLSTAKRSTASLSVYGGTIAVKACKTPTSGQLWVTVDGVTTKVSLYRSYSGCGTVFSKKFSTGLHTVTLSAKATSGTRKWASVDQVSVS